MSKYYTLKEISQLFNIPKSTLRYWETEGIITSSRNENNDYREYNTEDLIKISDIIFYRNLNYPIKSLKDIYNITIQENENLLTSSIEDLDQKIISLQETKNNLDHRLQSIKAFKELSQGHFLQSEPPFDKIVHIHLGHTTNIGHYLKDQSVLAIAFDFNTDIIQIYGTTDLTMGTTLLWDKKAMVKKYQPCLIKISDDQKPVIVNDIPKHNYGAIIGTYLVTDKTDDYFKGWIEILE